MESEIIAGPLRAFDWLQEKRADDPVARRDCATAYLDFRIHRRKAARGEICQIPWCIQCRVFVSSSCSHSIFLFHFSSRLILMSFFFIGNLADYDMS